MVPLTDSLLDSAHLLLVGTTDWIGAVEDELQARTDATVRTAATAARAREALADPPDCLLTEYALGEETGIDLLSTVRSETATLPVVVCTASGDEAVASEAIGAGAADYVPIEVADDGVEEVLERTERVVREARRSATRRERAKQFDALFHDARAATWVLEPNGRVSRLNRTARGMVETDAAAVVGDPFWGLSCWSDAAEDVERLVSNALEGGFASAVVSRPSGSEDPRVVELSVRVVEGERGDPVSIVVEGVDITDRVSLERDLRRSEELHRVTLNNMTDTVLITDEDGAYTYVCPNVHFIFGYTASEIRELGRIEDLLGEDLFDRAELAERGVLKNIECTATDKAGREHTLLVNVREVSIQGGTLLYSCRDVTKRKQREEALATLQGTARDFLYAGTHAEIAGHVVDDTPGVLDLEASAVYLFDAETNDLRPAAQSAAMEELNGPLPTVHADGETLPSHSFVADEALFFADVHDADRLDNRVTDLRSACYIPLGDHGVFVAGSPEVGVFDEVRRELADLLAATAEAALDRVSRESRLREQDRTLQQRNDQLTALNRINETIREIDQAIVRAETRSEIDHAVPELLTADDRFAFAWIGAVDPDGDGVVPRAWAGDEGGYLDSQSFPVERSGVEPAGRAAASGEVTLVGNVAAGLREEPWRSGALARDYLSVLSVPLVYNDLSHGVLTVYAGSRDAFEGTARDVLAELGETVAAAISAIERKNALLTSSMTRLEFAVDDPTFVLSRLAREAGCGLSYRGGVQQTAEGSYVFVAVEDVDAVAEAAADLVAVETVRRISADGEEGILRLGLSEPFVALDLADHGAVFREATAEPEGTTVAIDVPETVDSRGIARLVRETFGGAELRAKRALDRAPDEDLQSRVLGELTDRQLEVVQTAYYAGFFESPRESTGEDVAVALDISPTAFYGHVRTVQRTLFAAIFDEGAARVAASG
ncbi:bacterio-opsin activator domain-containing protein [Saliphagus infecundisoli]|uniref:Bacterio-opsin activator domain-containing protein n=1 Tax=Saliphagus infecundisoli TaxID=1849069 RepID=A0ABD5QEV0_9EURY|nr:bacterio-opsin activator domain-containing protein [Saliphagus infecundisoli]